MKRTFTALFGAIGFLSAGMSASLAEVTVLGWPGGPEETALRKAAEVYNGKAADADKVKLIFFNRDGFFDKLQADLAAGSKEFDANLLATYAIGRYAPFMDPITLPASAKDVFSDKVLATMQFGGKQYGVPTDLSLHFMYYRKDLIDQLLGNADWKKKYAEIAQAKLGKALEPKDPDQWTWDDYEATALFFTKSINPDSPTRYGTVLQMKNLLFNMMVWESTARSEGGNWMDDKGAITVDTPAFRKGLELYKRLYDAGATPKDSLSYEYAEANAAFGSGQAATMLQWNAAFGDLDSKEQEPDHRRQDRHRGAADRLGRALHPHPRARLGHQQELRAQGRRGQIPELAGHARSDGALRQGRRLAGAGRCRDAKLAADRPDLVKLGQFAGQYGFVMNGGTAAKTLPVYELQAKEFTGYWAGTQVSTRPSPTPARAWPNS